MRPKTEVTEDGIEIGFVHVGTPPLMVKICPSRPVEILTALPTRVSPPLKVKRSVN